MVASMIDQYAVIGHPVSHSLSPRIHSEFARQSGQTMRYIAKEIAIDALEAGLAQLKQAGFKGLNITLPFKEQVWQLADRKSERAERAGAVNTLIFQDDGSLFGDNTDGIGLCRDLADNHQIELENKRILLLGAGGAARGVIEPLLSCQPAELFIANRTVSKAEQLVALFDDLGHIQGGGFDDISGRYDVIINATAASLQGQVPPVADTVLGSHSCCYDMMYGRQDTAFITWAKQQGVHKTMDGLGMLVEQAAEAFYLWRGIRPDTQAVIALLRAR